MGSIDQSDAGDNLENADWSVIACRSYSLFISTKPSCRGIWGRLMWGTSKETFARLFPPHCAKLTCFFLLQVHAPIQMDMPSVELIQKENRLLRNEVGIIWFLRKGRLSILNLIFSLARCGGYTE